MMNAVNHPCRRLIRTAIEDLDLGDLAPGCVREIPEANFFRLLKIEDWQEKESSSSNRSCTHQDIWVHRDGSPKLRVQP
jgi:hypothetical protein